MTSGHSPRHNSLRHHRLLGSFTQTGVALKQSSPEVCGTTWNKRLKVRTFILYNTSHRETRTAAVYSAKCVLTSISNRQRGTINGRPVPERTDFGNLDPRSAARQTHLYPRHMSFTPQCSQAAIQWFYYSVYRITRKLLLILSYPGGMEVLVVLSTTSVNN